MYGSAIHHGLTRSQTANLSLRSVKTTLRSAFFNFFKLIKISGTVFGEAVGDSFGSVGEESLENKRGREGGWKGSMLKPAQLASTGREVRKAIRLSLGNERMLR